MWKIRTHKTPKNEWYIQSVSNINLEKIKVGTIVKAEITKAKGYLWFNLAIN